MERLLTFSARVGESNSISAVIPMISKENVRIMFGKCSEDFPRIESKEV